MTGKSLALLTPARKYQRTGLQKLNPSHTFREQAPVAANLQLSLETAVAAAAQKTHSNPVS